MNQPYTNSGHGHVWSRPDGVRMRCGGPGICKVCAVDKAGLDDLQRFPIPALNQPAYPPS